MFTAELDWKEFHKNLIGYKLDMNLDIGLVIEDETKLLLGQAIDLLPPKRKKEGVNAIHKDLSKQVIDTSWLASALHLKDGKLLTRMQGYIKEQNWDAVKQIVKDTGIFGGIRIQDFTESDIHRNERGRVIQYGTKILPTNRKAFKAYMKKATDDVGTLKASLADAFVRLGGRLPGWIKNKRAYAYYVNLSKKDTTPFIEVGSLVKYASDVDSRYNVLQTAIDIRARSMAAKIGGKLNKAQLKYFGKA